MLIMMHLSVMSLQISNLITNDAFISLLISPSANLIQQLFCHLTFIDVLMHVSSQEV